jgi:cytochrome c oxidase subunit 2
MTEQQIFIAAIVGFVVLTAGLGFALAQGIRLISAQVSQLAPPATAPARGAAKPAQPETPPAKAVTPAAPARRLAGAGILVFTLAIVAAGLGAGLFLRLMPAPASLEAGQVDVLFNSMLGIAVTIFLLVEGLIIYSALRFRRRRGEEGDGVALHGSSRLELAWTIVPAIIVIWLGIYSYQILVQLQTPRRDAMTVEVTGRQFQWVFHYPDAGVTATDLHVPQGKPVRLKLRSEDVIHSFWVPAFRIKQDAMPDRDTETFFTAEMAGEYPVVCAELCGAGHGQMGLISRAIVHSQDDFDAWMAEQAGAVPSNPAVALFTNTYGCSSCHALDAANAAGQIGPNLNGIGTAAASRVPGASPEQYIREAILNPNAFLAPECPTGACPPGVMPQDFGARMPAEHLDALVNFLLEQK